MSGLQEAGSMASEIPPSEVNPEHGKGKFLITFPDGTNGAYDTWEQAMEEMHKHREH